MPYRFPIVAWLLLMAAPTQAEDSFPYTLSWARRLSLRPVTAIVEAGSLTIIAQVDGRLTALNSADGKMVWRRRPGGPLDSALIASDELIFYADRFGEVGAVRVEDGASVWELRRAGWGSCKLQLAGDLLLVAAGDQILYAIDVTSGSERWRVRTGLRPGPAPIIMQGILIAPAADREMLNLNPSDGRRQFRWPTDIDVRQLLSSATGLSMAGHRWLRHFNPATGDLIWERWLGTSLVGNMHLTPRGRIVAVGENGWVYIVEASSGSVMISYPMPTKPVSQAWYQGQLLIVTKDGELTAFDDSGQKLWSATAGADWQLTAMGERLYVSSDSRLLIFESIVKQQSGLWWEVRRWGEKSGYIHRDQQEQPGGLQLTEESLSWRSGLTRRTTRIRVDPKTFRPHSYFSKRSEENQVLVTKASLDGERLLVTRSLHSGADTTVVMDTLLWGSFGPHPGAPRVDSLGIRAEHAERLHAQSRPRETHLPETLIPRLAAHSRDPGTTDSFVVVDILSASRYHVAAEFGQIDSSGTQQVVLYYDYDEEGPSESPRLSTVITFDAGGIDELIELPELSQRTIRVPSRKAMTWAPAQPRPGPRLRHALARPERLDTLRLRLPPELPDPLFLQDGQRQVIEASDSAKWLVITRQRLNPPSGAAPPSQLPDEAVRALQSSLFVQSDHRRIRTLAESITQNSLPDPMDIGRTIHDWVHDHMIPVDTNVRFKSALEVLDDLEGTCSEYTVLFLALSRAAGVPARVTVGYIVDKDGRLVLHIWPQIYVGYWLQIDPSWDAFPVGASHIATGKGLLTPSELAAMNLPLEILGLRADTLVVGSAVGAFGVDGEERYFLADAETLWETVNEADQTYDAEAMTEVLYEMILLPRNQRTSDALIRLGRQHLDRRETGDAEWAFQRLLRLTPPSRRHAEGIYYLGAAAEARGDTNSALDLFRRVAAEHPTSALADDAVGRLADWTSRNRGCLSALPLYTHLLERYNDSGWADVARAAVRRCRETTHE